MSNKTRKRGDTAPDVYNIVEDDGSASDLTGFSFRLTINAEEAPADQTNEILQMVGVVTGNRVTFAPSVVESNALVPGAYFFDVQMYRASGQLIKTIDDGEYEIIQDITKESN